MDVYYILLQFYKQMNKRYESGDDPGGHSQSEGAAENPEEHPERLQHRRDLKRVAVVPLWLVGHYRPETTREHKECR